MPLSQAAVARLPSLPMHPLQVLLQVALLAEGHGACWHWARVGLLVGVDAEVRVKLAQIHEYLPAVLLLWIEKKVFRDILEMSGSNHVSDFVVTHAHFLCRIIDLLHSFFNFMLKLSLGLLRPLGGLLLRFILATNMSALVHPLDSHVVPLLQNVNHEILALGHVLSLDIVVLHV